MTIPNDIIEKMISKFEAGYNCTQLENEYSYNRRLISSVLKSYGYVIQRGYTEQQINEAVQLYNMNVSLTEIAKRLHIDRGQLSYKLEELGIRMRIDPKNHIGIFVENEHTTEIKNRYLNGESIKQIAESLHRATSYVYRILRHYDVIKTNRLTTKYHMTWQPFHNVNTQEQAYWLGFVYADGTISSGPSRYTLELQISDKDIKHIYVFRDFINTQPATHVSVRTVNTNFKPNGIRTVRCCVNDVHMIQDLISLGCTPKKSLTKQFPYQLPNKLWNHFIRGYFDGNGCVFKSQGQTSFCFTSSFQMCNDISDILLKENVIHNRTKIKETGKAYSVRFGGNIQSRRFFHYIYDDASVYLIRKYNVFKNAVLGES